MTRRDTLTIKTVSGEWKQVIPSKITGVRASEFPAYCATVYHGYNHRANVELDVQETREIIRELPLQGCKYRLPSVRQCWGMRQQYDGPPLDCWRCLLTDIYYRAGHGDMRIPDVPPDKPSCVFYVGIIGLVMWASVSVCHSFAAEGDVAIWKDRAIRAEQALKAKQTEKKPAAVFRGQTGKKGRGGRR